jgi:hypothetical protein
MASIVYIHWDEEEAFPAAEALRKNGHGVRIHSDSKAKLDFASVPEALIVSLDRLPSHGREIADYFATTKKLMNVKLFFLGGKQDVVDLACDRVPAALACASIEELLEHLDGIEPPVPVVPAKVKGPLARVTAATRAAKSGRPKAGG